MSSEDCLFCKIVAGDIPADVVQSTDRAVAFRDINPQAPTHVLVIPRSHHAERRRAGRRRAGASAHLVERRRRSRGGRRGRGLPAGLQHRRGRRADGVPHAPAPAGRPADDLAARLIRARSSTNLRVLSTGSRKTASSRTRPRGGTCGAGRGWRPARSRHPRRCSGPAPFAGCPAGMGEPVPRRARGDRLGRRTDPGSSPPAYGAITGSPWNDGSVTWSGRSSG